MLVKGLIATNVDSGNEFKGSNGNLNVDSDYGNGGSILKKPTLPKDQPTTFTNVMQFVVEWFDFEESKHASGDVSRGRLFL